MSKLSRRRPAVTRRVKRGIWCVITLATVAALTYNLEEIIKKYIKKDVIVVVNRYHVKQQQFPAVTFCNMNPFRKSNVEANSELADLLGTSASTAVKKRRKRDTEGTPKERKKRYIEAPACSLDNGHTPSGYCFALASHTDKYLGSTYTWLYRTSWYTADDACEKHPGWELAVPDSEQKYNFLKNHPDIFSGDLAHEKYWINGRYSAGEYYWGLSPTRVMEWAAWDNGFPKNTGCMYGNRKASHKWGDTYCIRSYLVLCQMFDQNILETTTEQMTTAIETTTVAVSTAQETTTLLQTTAPDLQQTTRDTVDMDTTKSEQTTQADSTAQQTTTQESYTLTPTETMTSINEVTTDNKATVPVTEDVSTVVTITTEDITTESDIPLTSSTSGIITDQTTAQGVSGTVTDRASTLTYADDSTITTGTILNTVEETTAQTLVQSTVSGNVTTTINVQATDTMVSSITGASTEESTLVSNNVQQTTVSVDSSIDQTTDTIASSITEASTSVTNNVQQTTVSVDTTIDHTTDTIASGITGASTKENTPASSASNLEDNTASSTSYLEGSTPSSALNLEGSTSVISTGDSSDTNTSSSEGITMTTPTPVVTTYNPPPVPDPVKVEGSKFPERIETTEDFADEQRTYEVLAGISEDVKKTLGYKAGEFIVDCQYAGYSCEISEFSYFYNSVHGNCYMFNSGWNESLSVKWSKQIGPRYGLKVVLNINQDEYIEKFGQAAGVRVVVHAQAKMPFPEDEGLLARPGQLTSVSIVKVAIKKLGRPYTDCFKLEEKNLTRNVYEEYHNVNYTTLACFKTCFQRYVMEECGCSDPGYPSNGAAFGYVNLAPCNSSNIQQDDCTYNITRMYAANELDCDCEDPCEEDVYIPEVSATRWPADMAVEPFKARHYDKISYIVDSNKTEKLQENLAKVEVYFHSFDFEKIEEKPSYTDQSFFTDVGGSLGLWIGWSLVTIFEFSEFLIDLIILACVKRKSGKVDKDDIMVDPPPKPACLPRRSMNYIHQDASEMTLFPRVKKPSKPVSKVPPSTLTALSEVHRDSGISSASSIEESEGKHSRIGRRTRLSKSRANTSKERLMGESPDTERSSATSRSNHVTAYHH